MKRHAFSMTEILVVIAIIMVMIAIGLPVAQSARLASEKSKTIAAMHQIGVALSVYRQDNNQSVEYGGVVEMGMPPDNFSPFCTSELFTKHGNNPNSGLFSLNWDLGRTDDWKAYTTTYEADSVSIFDDNYERDLPKSKQWGNWQILALRLDTSIKQFDKRGWPFWPAWFHH